MSNAGEQLVDEILVMDSQSGSREAMDMLVSRWQKRLWQHAFRLVGDADAAWDVTQQSWLGIISGLRRLHDPASFKAWAYRITTNKSIDWISRHRAERQISVEDLDNHPQSRRQETGIRELLEKLHIRKRVVLCLYYFEQLSVAEISVALNVPKGTVKSRLYKAREELRTLWRECTEC